MLSARCTRRFIWPTCNSCSVCHRMTRSSGTRFYSTTTGDLADASGLSTGAGISCVESKENLLRMIFAALGLSVERVNALPGWPFMRSESIQHRLTGIAGPSGRVPGSNRMPSNWPGCATVALCRAAAVTDTMV